MDRLLFGDAFNDVAGFQKMIGSESPIHFINPHDELFQSRFNILKEEVDELKAAATDHNILKIVDSALDTAYVALSIIDEFGMASMIGPYVDKEIALEEKVASWPDTWMEMNGLPASAHAAHRYLTVWTNTLYKTQFQPDKMIYCLYNIAIVPTLLAVVVPWFDIWNAIQKANMAKQNPDGSITRSPTGKILKPDGWKSPDDDTITAFIRKKVPFTA